MCVCVFFQVRLDEVCPGVAFIQRWQPEQHDVAGCGQWSDTAGPGPSGGFLDTKRLHQTLLNRITTQKRLFFSCF